MLSFAARHGSTERVSGLVARSEYAGKVYVDLCDSQWRAVEVTASEWRVVMILRFGSDALQECSRCLNRSAEGRSKNS